MFIRFFKSNQQATLFALPILTFLLWVMGFKNHVVLSNLNGMPLYKVLLVSNGSGAWIFYKILAFVLVVVEAIYLNLVLNFHEVLYKRSHLPSLFYCILMSLFVPFLNLNAVLAINFLLILLLDKILLLYKSNTLTIAFEGSLIIGLCSLIYFPSIVYCIMLFLGLLILRTFSWRDFIGSLIGLLLPYYFFSIYLFWVDGLGDFWLKLIPSFFNHSIKLGFNLAAPQKVLMLTYAALLVLSLFKLQTNYFKNTIKVRNFQIVIGLFLIISASSFVLCPIIQIEHLCIMAIPSSIFISYYFLSVKNRLMLELVFLFILFLIIYNQIIYKY